MCCLFLLSLLFSSCEKEKNAIDALPSFIRSFSYLDSLSQIDEGDKIFSFLKKKKWNFDSPMIWAETGSGEKLFIAECPRGGVEEELKISVDKVYRFKSWDILRLSEEEGSLRIAFFNDFIFLSDAGYAVEESLLCFSGMENGLSDEFVELMKMKPGFHFCSTHDLLGGIKNKLLPLDSRLIYQKMKNGVCEGEVLRYEIQKGTGDNDWKRILNIMPEGVNEFGIHSYELNNKSNSDFEKILIRDVSGSYSYFSVSNPVGDDYEYLCFPIGEGAGKVVDLIKDEFGITHEKNAPPFVGAELAMFELSKECDVFPFMPEMKQPYIFAVGNYLLLSNSEAAMDYFLDSYLTNRVLLETKGGVGILYDGFEDDVLEGSIIYAEKKSDRVFVKITPTDSDRILFKFLERNEGIQGDGVSVKKSKFNLKGDCVFPPVVLPTEKTSGRIVVQDELNYLYFCSLNGEFLFKNKLEGKIISEIQSYEDPFTKTLYFVFNTKNEIHVMDQEGQPLDNFPIQLNSPASNGLTVVPFLNRSKVYAMLNCENGNLYAYDLTDKGKPLQNWNPLPGVGALRESIVFFENQKESRILFVNQKNELLSLDRFAKERFSPFALEDGFSRKIYSDIHPGADRMVFHDGKGRLKIVNKKGESFYLSISDGTREGDFVYGDVLGDGRKDYVFHSGNEISIYTYKGRSFEKIMEKEFDLDWEDVFIVEHEKGKDFLGAYIQNKIYLFDGDLNLKNGFPLEGSAGFQLKTINETTDLLITYKDDDVISYIINN